MRQEETNMGKKRPKYLTERHRRVLEVIERFIESKGYSPTYREISERANISQGNALARTLDQLEEMGFIERERRVSRSIRILKRSDESPQPGKLGDFMRSAAAPGNIIIPIIGRITAGSPLPVPQSDLAYFDPDHNVEIPQNMLPKFVNPETLFALEVRGYSLVDAMIFDGDIVVMQPAHNARNGELVAVWLSDRDETTLKYFYFEHDHIRLQPANPAMRPIFIENPSIVDVQGKVVLIVRSSFGRIRDDMDSYLLEAGAVGQKVTQVIFQVNRNTQLTPDFLREQLLPYLQGIASLQAILLRIQQREHQDLVIKSITQYSPITISFEGIKELIEILKYLRKSWREHELIMARMEERKSKIDIALAEAKIQEMNLNRIIDKTDLEKATLEIEIKRQEARQIKIENDHAELELQKKKLQIALDILATYGKSLSEEETSKLISQVLASITLITTSQLEVSEIKTTSL
jgi:repressor LexA